MKSSTYILLAVCLGLLIFFIFDNISRTHDDNELKQKYEKEIADLSHRLEESNAVRDNLIHNLDSLRAASKDILRSDSVKVVEIREVPRQLQTLTAKQTQDKMLEFYTNR